MSYPLWPALSSDLMPLYYHLWCLKKQQLLSPHKEDDPKEVNFKVSAIHRQEQYVHQMSSMPGVVGGHFQHLLQHTVSSVI